MRRWFAGMLILAGLPCLATARDEDESWCCRAGELSRAERTVCLRSGGQVLDEVGVAEGLCAAPRADQARTRIVVGTTQDTILGCRTDATKPCSLREAVHWANDLGGRVEVVFDISAQDAGYRAARGVWVITLVQDLPILTTRGTAIDATTQPTAGTVPAAGVGGCLRPLVELTGTGASSRGLEVNGNQNAISGLAIYGFAGAGVRVAGHGNRLTCNYLGTNAAEAAGLGNVNGVAVRGVGDNNRIGAAGAGNLIAGNSNAGVLVHGRVANTAIEGNFIGLSSDGVTKLANGTGVIIEQGATATRVGGLGGRAADRCSGGCNVISGNTTHGVVIDGADNSRVVGNFIGVAASGTQAVGNTLDGVRIVASHGVRVGGGKPDLANVISGNRNGVFVTGSSARRAEQNTIEGNILGGDVHGAAVLPNRHRGIQLSSGAMHTVVGGSYNQGNTIVGNLDGGIYLDDGASHNQILDNWIGTNRTGAKLGNSLGIAFHRGANANLVGGGREHGNVIAFNSGDGVHVEGTSTIHNGFTGNSIYGNLGKGISLVDGGNGPHHPWLRVWERRALGGGRYYVVGQLQPEYADYTVDCCADGGAQGRYCEVSGVTTDAVRKGWFGCTVDTHGLANLSFTVSDPNGLDTSEFLVAGKPAHVGSWPFDMDYWEMDPDNQCPVNPHHHAGWGHFPSRDMILGGFWQGMGWKEGIVDIPGIAHTVFHTRGFFCGPFMNYATPAMFTGELYWESSMHTCTCVAGDLDNNFGLRTPEGTGYNINTQRYFDSSPSAVDNLPCPPDGCDANDWQSPRLTYIADWLAQMNQTTQHVRPLMTLEIDRCDGFTDWNDHPFWAMLDTPLDVTAIRQRIDGKKAMVIGVWTMDCEHQCRSEVHPVLVMAVQDRAPATADGAGREEWHFFARNRSNQSFCGENINYGPHDWKIRFKGRARPCTIAGINGFAHEEDDDSVWWRIDRKGKDVLVTTHLPNDDDWLVGTVVIDWK